MKPIRLKLRYSAANIQRYYHVYSGGERVGRLLRYHRRYDASLKLSAARHSPTWRLYTTHKAAMGEYARRGDALRAMRKAMDGA